MLQRALALVVIMTFVNVALMGTASYKAVEHMDSVEFCGQTCHSVMAPEYTAYLNSPHSRVACVDCHIGSGAPWFVRAKISGVRQLFAVNLKTYSRPIPSPVHNLRPSRDTCEHCHWPERFTGDKFLVKTKYADDEQNTPATTVLLVKIGGRTTQGLVGIHGRHLAAAERIEYVSTDGRRQVIPRVTYTQDDGKKVEYVSDEVKPTAEQLARAERRKMDCVDCHNRPTHAFEMPERAVDEAITAGRIDRQLPYVKKQAVAALRVEYPDRATASEKIPQAIADFYKAKYPETYQSKRPHRRDRGPAGQGDLPAQHLPRDEDHLGHPSQQHRPRRFPRLLPLPRRQAQEPPTAASSTTTAPPATRSSPWKRKIRRSWPISV